MENLWDNNHSMGQMKRAASLQPLCMARPERFELPTAWFVACCAKLIIINIFNNLRIAFSPIEFIRNTYKSLFCINVILLYGTLLFYTPTAFSDELTISLGSYHAAYRAELREINALNEFNPGVGWQNENWSAGIYENSMKRGSVYAARKFTNNRCFAFAGVVTGYPVNFPILPFVGAGINIGDLQIVVFPGAVQVEGSFKPLIVIGLSVRIGI